MHKNEKCNKMSATANKHTRKCTQTAQVVKSITNI